MHRRRGHRLWLSSQAHVLNSGPVAFGYPRQAPFKATAGDDLFNPINYDEPTSFRLIKRDIEADRNSEPEQFPIRETILPPSLIQ
jgi:hypothetical protein